MGYRSNVGYLVMVGDNNGDNREEAEKLFHMIVNEAKASDDTKEMFNDLEEKGDIQLEIDEKQLIIKYRAYNVKWYEDYPDVAAHERFIDMVEEYVSEDLNEKGLLSYAYIRIGEESDDTEIKEGGTYEASQYMYLSRDIQWDI